MKFTRQGSDKWHQEIPGARWFKADLHIHTIDDHAGGRCRLPNGIDGRPDDPNTLATYARRFLQAAVQNRIQVLGLTPHSPRVGTTPETSAVWRIVEEWNSGTDDDGVPFRDKVYAVFPGFEPNVNDGGSGVHLVFLFDPEIGRDRYLRIFDAIMDGGPVWEDGGLRLTPRDAKGVFETLDQQRGKSRCEAEEWGYAVLAPHFRGEHGVLREVRKQVLENFPSERIAGYELADSQLPEDFDRKKKPGLFLLPFMEENRQAFFHGSDAYSVERIGKLHTWLKLASPRVEALRQAFIASDSRMRIGFSRNAQGELEPISKPPDVMFSERPWLKRVTIRGAASFFGGKQGDRSSGTTFPLSPDLTCLIGGSMTGKSTFLDGLRVHFGSRLPQDESIREQVEARGKNLFLAGSPDVEIECPGSDPTADLASRWPAQFFAQNELQRLSLEAGAIEEILARLAPSETKRILRLRADLEELDGGLREQAARLGEIDQDVGDAEQACERARAAAKALEAFAEAGIDRLQQAGRDSQTWNGAAEAVEEIHEAVHAAAGSIAGFEVPELSDEASKALRAASRDPTTLDLAGRWERIDEGIEAIQNDLERWAGDARRFADTLAGHAADVRKEVERALAEKGHDAGKLKEFQVLSKQAGLLASYEANLREARERLEETEREFERLQRARDELVTEQRGAFDRVIAEIDREFGERIRARRIDEGESSDFDDFLRELAERGVTRWWHGLDETSRPSPRRLLDCLERNQLGKVGMSGAVQETLRESMTRARRRKLAALRFPDRYFVALRLDDGSYRRLDELSGGQRVSVLLSLLLESKDDRPLVVDQPEDELDNRFLFETVLPALKRLKGRRQVIVATHNANIVVNGDADLVIQLEATAHQGRVACVGAIEEHVVRDAIVRTVDGGEEAFRLRRRKYGF